MTELGRPLALVSRLRGVESEQQHVIAAETGIERFEVAQRPNQQARADNHDERQGNLGDHQTAAQTSSLPGGGQITRAGLHRLVPAHSGCAKRRRQAKRDSGGKRDQQREPEDRRVGMNVERYPVRPVRHQSDEHRASPIGEEHPKGAAHQRQQDALGE